MSKKLSQESFLQSRYQAISLGTQAHTVHHRVRNRECCPSSSSTIKKILTPKFLFFVFFVFLSSSLFSFVFCSLFSVLCSLFSFSVLFSLFSLFSLLFFFLFFSFFFFSSSHHHSSFIILVIIIIIIIIISSHLISSHLSLSLLTPYICPSATPHHVDISGSHTDRVEACKRKTKENNYNHQTKGNRRTRRGSC